MSFMMTQEDREKARLPIHSAMSVPERDALARCTAAMRAWVLDELGRPENTMSVQELIDERWEMDEAIARDDAAALVY